MTTSNELFSIRFATPDDATILAHHRISMFRDIGKVMSADNERELYEAAVEEFATLVARGEYVGWLVTISNGDVIAGGGMHIKPQLARLSADETRIVTTPVPLVVNVYTEPQWRRRGAARALMQALMQWSKEQNFDRVLLHASPEGRPLYEALGFVESNEMRWIPS